MSSDINATFGGLSSHSEYAVLEKPTDGRGMIDDLSFFGSASRLSALSALLEVELKNKRIRTYSSKDEVNDVMRYLIKKAKTAEEEAGANVIYLAFGFLKWYENGVGEPKYAP